MRMVNTAFSVTGSSPRLRGTHARGVLLARQRGFIPAPAGNAPNITVWSP